jgi:hypothetical protein
MSEAPLDEASAALRAGRVADVGHLLKAGGLHEVEQEIARLAAGGLAAHVVLVPVGDSLAPWHALWARQGYAPATDLLLLFNGHRWEARGWNLTAASIDSALAAAEPALHAYYGHGLAGLANLGRATGRRSRNHARFVLGSSFSGRPGLGAAAAAAVGWVMSAAAGARDRHRSLARRRPRRGGVHRGGLATEELSSGGGRLRDKATGCAISWTRSRPQPQAAPAKGGVADCKLQQMENDRGCAQRLQATGDADAQGTIAWTCRALSPIGQTAVGGSAVRRQAGSARRRRNWPSPPCRWWRAWSRVGPPGSTT